MTQTTKGPLRDAISVGVMKKEDTPRSLRNGGLEFTSGHKQWERRRCCISAPLQDDQSISIPNLFYRIGELNQKLLTFINGQIMPNIYSKPDARIVFDVQRRSNFIQNIYLNFIAEVVFKFRMMPCLRRFFGTRSPCPHGYAAPLQQNKCLHRKDMT